MHLYFNVHFEFLLFSNWSARCQPCVKHFSHWYFDRQTAPVSSLFIVYCLAVYLKSCLLLENQYLNCFVWLPRVVIKWNSIYESPALIKIK